MNFCSPPLIETYREGAVCPSLCLLVQFGFKELKHTQQINAIVAVAARNFICMHACNLQTRAGVLVPPVGV